MLAPGHEAEIAKRNETFSFNSLESLSRPDSILEAAVQSFPEHNFSAIINILLCFLMISALIGGFYWLDRTNTYHVPKSPRELI